ncbi:MAG: molybdopterin molybdenumtransferase MoeA, partial [Solimicrobium sp.]|nr:molybdopterin molybdenumtransferase MoeA [Solimicrobium sp.]
MITLSVSQAQQHIQTAMEPITESETISLDCALDRISAENISAPINVPAFDNSAMDGYAFYALDLASNKRLHIVGSAFAGHPFPMPLQAGQAIRITTGARIPERCDTVLPQELAIFEDDNTLDMRNVVVRAGQHLRRCGEDTKIGDISIAKGCRLGPAELGVLASLGISEVNVHRRLRIALFSTGDELRSVKKTTDNGCIYDSNRITLSGMLTRAGMEVIDLGIFSDDPTALKAALQKTYQQVDAIITSGGIADGSADYTKQVMQEFADMTFMSINMRPGRPFAFGKIAQSTKNTYLFGLPGNPVAAMISFYFLVRPALHLLNGAQVATPLQIDATATQAIHKKIGRTEFQRGICNLSAQGKLQVSTTGGQGSGIISSMAQANCLIVLNPEQGDI